MTKKRPRGDAALIARRVNEFLEDYAPQFLTTSDHTLKAYRDAITLFFAFLQEQGVGPETLERSHLAREWIERWIAWLKTERGNSPDTCNNRLASLRRFLEYVGSRDVGMQYLFLESKQVKRQKSAKTKVCGMSPEAVDALLDAPDTATEIGRRDLTFMTVMYATGARLDELRSLTVRQVHLDAPKPYVNLLGKGGKTRASYLLPRAAKMLRKYMKEALGPEPAPSDLLFPSRVTGGKMSEQAWDNRIKKYAAAANAACADVPARAHAHQLRHAAASEWLDAGMNVVEVQHMLGHEQLSTTMRYLDIRMPSKSKAMSVLESEDDKKKTRKWRNQDGTLVGFLGLGRRS